jgi:serine/threonine-protein kinase
VSVICARCHASVPDGGRFCPSCGTPAGGAGDAASNDVTFLSDDGTRMAPVAAAPPAHAPAAASGWLSSSGSIDHGRFAPGAVLDHRYRVIGLLGRGGMGEVYRADDLRLGQQVALKFLPEALSRDPVRLAQFHNEVRTARQVSHPNVCRVYDIGDIDGSLFITMEYVDGEDLSLLLRRIGRLPEDKALEIARQMCAGLAAAHERGILHRDLKPANVMLDGTGRVRLMDFSLAAVGEVTDIRAGTPAYMAPEQLSGKEVTVQSDIYALGLVLYELFTGRRAFDAKTLAELIEQHESGAITAPTDLVKTIDPTIERAIMRCLDAAPARRPGSALAVSAALPGGDPLAAALAAGETPSPEMVAAAGGDSAMITPAAGVGWLVVAVTLAIGGAALHDRGSILARVPLSKPIAVLVDRAEMIRQSVGYTEPAVDSAFGLNYDSAYLDWGADHGSRESHWAELPSGRPAALRFWYRTSPRALISLNRGGAVTPSDPPIQLHGMTGVTLDTKGRLLRFEAAPAQVESGEAVAPRGPVNWDTLFAAAEIDRATFTPTAPGRTPATFADERHAWVGTLPDTKISVRIEAAAYRGRPVSFDIIGPWNGAAREPTDPASAPVGAGGNPYIIVILLVGAALAGRANLKSGRADKRGAFRIAAFIFFVLVGQWILNPHVTDLGDEEQRAFIRIGVALFLGGVLYLLYLGIEPFVRKHWPTMLVGWSRVLGGRLRDPLVGRDVLVGVAAGAALTFVNLATDFLRPAHWRSALPLRVDITALLGARPFAVACLQAMNVGLQNGLFTVFEFVGLRSIVDRLAGWALRLAVRAFGFNAARFTLSRAAADRIFVALAVALVTVVSVYDAPAGERLTGVIDQIASTTLVLVLLLRIGLFAVVIMSFVNSVLVAAPLTLDGSRLYAPESWCALAIIGALAAFGLWQARAGEPLFSARV